MNVTITRFPTFAKLVSLYMPCKVLKIHNKDKEKLQNMEKQVKRQIFFFLIHIGQVYPKVRNKEVVSQNIYFLQPTHIPFH